MKTEEEIKKEILKHKEFIKSIDFEYDPFAGIEEADSQSWINALNWVLEDKMKITCLFKDETAIHKRNGGIYAVDVPRCVRIDDEETGLIIISTKERDQLGNKNKALDVLTCWKNYRKN